MSIVLGFTRAEMVSILEYMAIVPPTSKQIHYWRERGVISYDLIGAKTAIYSFQTVVDLALLVQMGQQGLSLEAGKLTLELLRQRYHWGTEREPPEGLALMTDGREVVPLELDELLIERLNGKAVWRAFTLKPRQVLQHTLSTILALSLSDRLRLQELKQAEGQGGNPPHKAAG